MLKRTPAAPADAPSRRSAHHKLIATEAMKAGYAADDGVALHFRGRELAHVVSSRQHARAYRVENAGCGTTEREITPVYLNGSISA